MYQVVKNYMERMSGLKAEGMEYVYSYHVDLEENSRLSGCEMNIRVMQDQVVLTAVLPLAIRSKEKYGVACKLAKYNSNRLRREESGVFELNQLRSRIQFLLVAKDPTSEEELQEHIDYCLSEVRRYSETMLHMVCQESDAVYEQEQEQLESERQAAERAERTRQYRDVPVMGKLMSLLGIIDKEIEDDTLCLSAPVEDDESEAAEEKSEEKSVETTEEKPEEKSEEQAEA